MIVILVLSMLSISVRLRNKRQSPFLVQKIGNDTVSIVTRVVNWPINLVSNGVANVEDLFNAQAENDHLKNKLITWLKLKLVIVHLKLKTRN